MGISCRHHFAKHIKSEQERLQTVPEVSHGHMRHIPHSLSTRMCACLPTQSSFCLCTAPSATRAHLRSAAPNLSEQLLEPPVRHAPAPEMVDRMEVRPAHSGPAPRCWKRAYGMNFPPLPPLNRPVLKKAPSPSAAFPAEPRHLFFCFSKKNNPARILGPDFLLNTVLLYAQSRCAPYWL